MLIFLKCKNSGDFEEEIRDIINISTHIESQTPKLKDDINNFIMRQGFLWFFSSVLLFLICLNTITFYIINKRIVRANTPILIILLILDWFFFNIILNFFE